MPHTRLNRLGLLLTAVVQLLLPAFASVADARAESASVRGASSHIEEHGSSKCVPVHSAECAVCRVLANGATASSAPAFLVAATRVINSLPPQYGRLAISAVAPGDPSQRAPPAA